MKYFIIIIIFSYFSEVYAETVGKETGLELPRFVSTKTSESNLRVGASTDYPIKLTFIIKNLPLKIIDEHENWRRVVDIDENVGWIHKRLLIGKRHGLIMTSYNEGAQILKKPKGKVVGKIGNRNIVKINKCLVSWCHINYNNNSGWINKINLWGVNKKEKFNLPFYQFIIDKYWELI